MSVDVNLRARQILNDPSLRPNDRVKNPEALLIMLAESMRGNPDKLASMLAEITDPDVRESMQAAIEARLA